MSWAREAVEALRRIILIEHRVDSLSEQVKSLASSCADMDRRLHRIEAKFELLEHMGTSRRRLPGKREK
jgi:hypothetical protein